MEVIINDHCAVDA